MLKLQIVILLCWQALLPYCFQGLMKRTSRQIKEVKQYNTSLNESKKKLMLTTGFEPWKISKTLAHKRRFKPL